MSALPVEMPSSEAVPADAETVMRRVWAVPDDALPELPSWLGRGNRQVSAGKRPARAAQAARPVRTVRQSGPVSGAWRARDGASSGPVRLTKRGRVAVAVLATMLAGGLCVAGATAAQATSGAGSPSNGTPRAEQVVVEPGDTLWSIARSAGPGADTQAIVQEIMQVNRLANPDIAPGQRLRVPRA
jgi:nucleoid-associated protein YgaU